MSSKLGVVRIGTGLELDPNESRFLNCFAIPISPYLKCALSGHFPHLFTPYRRRDCVNSNDISSRCHSQFQITGL